MKTIFCSRYFSWKRFSRVVEWAERVERNIRQMPRNGRAIMGAVVPRYSKEEFAGHADAVHEKDIPLKLAASSRRDFFHLISDGIYGAALTSLLCEDLYGGTNKLRPGAVPEPASGPRRVYDLRPRQPHFEPKAKAVIQLLMNGAPSQMDLFDPKPMLEKHRGQSF